MATNDHPALPQAWPFIPISGLKGAVPENPFLQDDFCTQKLRYFYSPEISVLLLSHTPGIGSFSMWCWCKEGVHCFSHVAVLKS